MSAFKALTVFWAFVFWLVAVFKWIPDIVGVVVGDPVIKTALIIGLSGTLLLPIYFLMQKKINL